MPKPAPRKSRGRTVSQRRGAASAFAPSTSLGASADKCLAPTTTARPARARLNRAVFLDRDGTMTVDMEFSTDPAKLAPLPGALDGLKALQKAGYKLVVITNQSGVARGLFDEASLRAFHDYMADWFGARRIMLAGVYYCPHYAEGRVAKYAVACDCRKPAPGMLLRAAADLTLDLKQCWMVGDRDCDIGAGRAAGCRTIRVGDKPNGEEPADFVAADLREAARIILTH